MRICVPSIVVVVVTRRQFTAVGDAAGKRVAIAARYRCLRVTIFVVRSRCLRYVIFTRLVVPVSDRRLPNQTVGRVNRHKNKPPSVRRVCRRHFDFRTRSIAELNSAREIDVRRPVGAIFVFGRTSVVSPASDGSVEQQRQWPRNQYDNTAATPTPHGRRSSRYVRARFAPPDRRPPVRKFQTGTTVVKNNVNQLLCWPHPLFLRPRACASLVGP